MAIGVEAIGSSRFTMNQIILWREVFGNCTFVPSRGLLYVNQRGCRLHVLTRLVDSCA